MRTFISGALAAILLVGAGTAGAAVTQKQAEEQAKHPPNKQNTFKWYNGLMDNGVKNTNSRPIGPTAQTGKRPIGPTDSNLEARQIGPTDPKLMTPAQRAAANQCDEKP